MTVLRIKNQSEYAFMVWMDSFPNSKHPLDEERFMIFAKTVIRYRSKKWLNYENFEKAVKSHSNHFDEENIEKYFNRLIDYVAFSKVNALPAIKLVDGTERFEQIGVRNGNMYRIAISREEYDNGGASTATLRNI